MSSRPISVSSSRCFGLVYHPSFLFRILSFSAILQHSRCRSRRRVGHHTHHLHRHRPHHLLPRRRPPPHRPKGRSCHRWGLWAVSLSSSCPNSASPPCRETSCHLPRLSDGRGLGCPNRDYYYASLWAGLGLLAGKSPRKMRCTQAGPRSRGSAHSEGDFLDSSSGCAGLSSLPASQN